MKLEVLDITCDGPNDCHATLKVGDELICSKLIEVTGEVPGLNFSNMLFANILMFAGVLREFCNKHFEYCEGRGHQLPWDFGDVDKSLLIDAVECTKRTMCEADIREAAGQMLRLLEEDKY